MSWRALALFAVLFAAVGVYGWFHGAWRARRAHDAWPDDGHMMPPS